MADVISIAIALDTAPVLAGTRQVTQALHQVETAEQSVQQQTATMERVTHQAAQALQRESQAARTTGQAVQSTAQSTQALAQQDQVLASAATQAGQALTRQAQAAQKAAQDTSAMGQSARQASGLLTQMGGALQGMIAAGLGLAALRRGLEDVVQAALKQEQLKTTLVAITGSQKAAGEAYAFARAEAERLGLSNNVLIESYGRLLAATKGTSLEGQKAREMFQNYNETMRALNLTTDNQRDASRALNQILSQQAIQGDELRTELGSRIPLTQYLVEATNGAAKSLGEFNKMMEEGKFKGEAAVAVMYNLGIILQREIGQKGADAALGAGAALARFDNAVNDLKVALGEGLLPAVSQVARALAEFIRQGEAGAKTFGGAFTDMILQMTSALIGLAGAAIVTGKYIAALGAGIAFGPEAWNAGWEDVKQTVADTVALQEKLISGGFAKPAAQAARTPSQDKLPVVPGGGAAEEKKARGKTEADRESTKLASEQLSLRNQINSAYDKATNSERELTKLHLERAKFSDKERDALLARYDETKLYEEANKLKDERLALDKQLQEALDKQLFTERELLQKKMEHLLYSKEEMAISLKLYDQEKARREEKERAVEAEKEAVRATEEHLQKVERLMDKLEPQRRRMSRAEQLQGTMSELAGETSDPYLLRQADEKREATLAFEEMQDQLERLKDLGEQTFDTLGDALTDFVTKGKLDFKGMVDSIASDLLRFASQTLMSQATKKGGWLEGALNLGLKALGIAGGFGGMNAATTANVQAGLNTNLIGNPELFQHGGEAFAGRPYLVGERGVELFVPKTSGTVVPNSQLSGGTTVVNVHVSGVQDAQSFVQSRGAVSRAMMGALSQARQQM